MGTKRVELSQREQVEMVVVLRNVATQYARTADERANVGWDDSAEMWTKSAKVLMGIVTKLEGCDRVAIETDGYGDYI